MDNEEWMMDKDPSKRPQSYEDLILILKAAVECERVRSPKTMNALHAIMVKHHLMQQPWLDKNAYSSKNQFFIVLQNALGDS